MAKFKEGDKVKFHGRPATVKQVIHEKDADYILDVQGDEFYAEDEEVTAANSCRNSVVAKALNAARVARNGYVDVHTIAKQEWNRAYRGNEPFGIDAEIKPNGDFKIQEVAHGKVDDSEVDWNPIADKVKRALLAAGNKSAVVKVNPYGNGITGNLGIARNACGTARNAGAYDVAGEAGKLFKDAYDDLAGCAAKLERLTTLGQPNDVPGNDNKIAAWAKDKARKVRDIMNKLDQGRL